MSAIDSGPDLGATPPRQTHPITPLVHAGRILPVALIVGLGVLGNVVGQLGAVPAILILIGVAVAVLAVTAGFQYLSWQRLTFWFDGEGDFRMASGVITRRERRLQLSRLQGVELVQPLVARVFGMAGVTIEVAGAGDSRAAVYYLTLPEAAALRNEVIARAAGLRPDSGEAPEQPLVSVPPKDLFWSLMLRGSTVGLLSLTVLIVITTALTSGVAGILLLFTGGVPLIMVFAEFTRYYDFTVAHSPDGLRLRSGLFQLKSQTIPPGRVQAVEFVQSWLWQRRDWVRVRLNVAGMQRADDQDGSQGGAEQVLLPVAPYDVALAVVGQVLPGVDARQIALQPAPHRARRRSWIQFKELGVGADDRVMVVSRGRFVRRLAVVPHARTQSVRVTQGPWERFLGLASMHVDSPPGPVKIVALHRDAGEARHLAEEQSRRGEETYRRDGHRRWMEP